MMNTRLLRPAAVTALRLGPSSGQLAARRLFSTPASAPHAYLSDLPLPAGQALSPDEDLSPVKCLVLNRPETKNALSVRMVGEMREAISNISATTGAARVLLLTSAAPGMFCSGADLKERASMSEQAVSDFLDSLKSMLDELEALALPTVAVMDGFALGGGCELALGCDLRVGGEHTKIALPEAKLGIIPGAGGTQRLTKLLGASKAKELIFTGRRLDGTEAERIGLLNVCAKAPSTALQEAVLLARQMLTSAPLSLSRCKHAVDFATANPLSDGLAYERKLYNELIRSADRQEGLRAFKEKRRPQWTGR